MREALAVLIAGVGLFSVGLERVSSGLQEGTSRTLRALIRHSTKSLSSCAAVGIVAGALMQSTSAVTTVLGSMAATGMITLRQALPIVAFANIGTTVLVFAGAIDIRVAVLFLVGLAGIVFPLRSDFRWRAVSSVVLGFALVMYGNDLMTAGASAFEGDPWFSTFLSSWYGSTAMSFGIGAAASFIAQSTTTVVLLAVALAGANLLEVDEAITMIYGANLGSTLTRILFTHGATGTMRQVSRFQDVFKIAGTVLFVSLFIVEAKFHVPLVQALVGRISSEALQLATVNLLFNGTMALAAALLARPLERFIVHTWPPSAVEDLSTPKYATHEALADPATAIDLIEKEQMRMLKSSRDYLAFVRPHVPETVKVHPGSLHKSFGVLFREIEHFQIALVGKQMDGTTSSRLANVQARQELLELIEDSLFQLASSAEYIAPVSKLAPLIENFAEALDFLLMFAGDAARTLDLDRAQFVFDLSSDRGDMMGGIRSLYLAPDQALSPEEKALLLRLTNLFERVVWMIQRYADLLLKNAVAAECEGGHPEFEDLGI